MKITGLDAYPVWGGSRNFMFVVVDTDEGIYGIGEAGLTGREEAVRGTLAHFATFLVGEDPFRIEHLWQMMFRGGFFPVRHAVAAALAAVDIALWDIKGKALGVPVYELLGGRVRDSVICYPHNRGRETAELVESCRASVAEGWRFVRWGLPAGAPFEPRPMVRRALEQMAAIREAVGDDIELLLDVHTRLDLADVVWLCRESEQFNPFFIEDPLRSEQLEGYAQLRGRTGTAIAAGEQLSSKWEFQRLIEQEWIDFARIDLGIAGGLTEAKKIAAMAEAHHIRVAVHNPLGPVSSAACLHLNLTIPNFAVQEQPARTGTMLTDVVSGQAEWKDGSLLPPQAPGLGIEFDREAAARHPFQLTEMPTLRRADGSVTNW